MPRPPIPREEEDRIKREWANPKWWPNPARLPTAREMWQHDDRKWSERTYQRLVSEARRQRREVPEDPPLVPWGDGWPQDDAEAVACLYRMLRAAHRRPEFPLNTRVSKWALRLRGVFTGTPEDSKVDLDTELLISAHDFAMRERAAESLGLPLHTADLDAYLVYRPWESLGNHHEWLAAVDRGEVPGLTVASLMEDEAAVYGWGEVVATSLKSFFLALEVSREYDPMSPERVALWEQALIDLRCLHEVSDRAEALEAAARWLEANAAPACGRDIAAGIMDAIKNGPPTVEAWANEEVSNGAREPETAEQG